MLVTEGRKPFPLRVMMEASKVVELALMMGEDGIVSHDVNLYIELVDMMVDGYVDAYDTSEGIIFTLNKTGLAVWKGVK